MVFIVFRMRVILHTLGPFFFLRANLLDNQGGGFWQDLVEIFPIDVIVFFISFFCCSFVCNVSSVASPTTTTTTITATGGVVSDGAVQGQAEERGLQPSGETEFQLDERESLARRRTAPFCQGCL